MTKKTTTIEDTIDPYMSVDHINYFVTGSMVVLLVLSVIGANRFQLATSTMATVGTALIVLLNIGVKMCRDLTTVTAYNKNDIKA